MITLPIARVRRDGAGHFIYDADYIAPSLHIGASPRLDGAAASHGRDARVQGRLDHARPARLVGRICAAGSRELLVVAHDSRERPDAASLHAGQARFIRNGCTSRSRASPARCARFRSTRIRGRCPPTTTISRKRASTCSTGTSARTSTWSSRRGGRRSRSSPSGQSLYTADIRDPRSFGPAAMDHRRHARRCRRTSSSTRLPTLTKVCSKKFVLELVRRAFPGLRLDHLPYPPATIAPQPDMQYFSVDARRSVLGHDRQHAGSRRVRTRRDSRHRAGVVGHRRGRKLAARTVASSADWLPPYLRPCHRRRAGGLAATDQGP